MNIRINIFDLCLLFLAMTVSVFAEPDKPFYQQNESPQHYLLEKGQEFRLFHHNSIILGQGTEWDQKQKLTDTPCFRIIDESDKTSGSFRQHQPMWVAPCTEYVLKYMIKVDKLEGPGPFVKFILYDYNTDVITIQQYPVDVDEPTDGWIERQVSLKTDYLTHEVILHLSSDVKGTCDVRFDKVYLKQVSEPGSLMPTPIKLLENESSYSEHVTDKQKVFTKIKLPITKDYYKLSFNINWEDFDGNAVMYVDWIGEYGDIIGKDYCEIYRIEGIQPNGNGIATRWKRQYGQKSDKASFKLDWHYNSDKNSGKSSVERVMHAPDQSRYAQIHIVWKKNYNGLLHFDNLKFIAEY